MTAFTYSILFLVATTVVAVAATPLMCAMATMTSVSYHIYTVELFLGNNSDCSGDAEVAIMEAMNQDLQLKIGSLSNAAPYVVQADLCPVIYDASRRALSNLPSSITWYGKGKCSVCPSRSRMRGRRLLDELTTAQEAAEMLGISQTQMLMEMFASNPRSCLYQAFDIQVRFNITETFYTSPHNPCKIQ